MPLITPPGPIANGMRIGLMGGSFNPAHEGHLYISQVALRRLGLNFVWWLVSPGNPLKDPADMATLASRMEQARTIARHPAIRVSDLERDSGSVYTIDTLRALKKRFCQVQFVWLMGSDNLMQFHRWKNWRGIAGEVPIAVVLRPGTVLAPLKAKAMAVLEPSRNTQPGPAPRLLILDGRRNPQSATAIRAKGCWQK
ncbi:MAG: nicotinate (nicotinamide) nucleotide adenylyltransferase [Rhizomicrobium sp.]